uniref:MD-2-related lipid-recognition domain-containing protein n=2 Tax=Stomoxys calcitrans TaxID=35570 RepID=A0A1I8NW07_STOCA
MNVYYRVDSKPITNASLKLSISKRGGATQKALYQYKVDACEFMRNTRRNPLADIFYTFFELRKYSNLNHTCPFNHDLIINRCRLNVQPLSILPIAPGDYKILTVWYKDEKPAANIDVVIKVN